jgi:uncharacterized protein YoxC
VPLAEVTTIDVLWIALSFFLVVLALAIAYLVVRLSGTVGRLTSFIQGLEREVLPVINQAGGTIERVNLQLDKVDRVTDSAVDAADSMDTAVRAVTLALTKPVEKISGLAEGLAHGVASLRARRDLRGAMRAGRDAASRREHEIEDELRRGARDEF